MLLVVKETLTKTFKNLQQLCGGFYKKFLRLPISLRKHKNLKNIRVLKKNLNFFRKYNTVKI